MLSNLSMWGLEKIIFLQWILVEINDVHVIWCKYYLFRFICKEVFAVKRSGATRLFNILHNYSQGVNWMGFEELLKIKERTNKFHVSRRNSLCIKYEYIRIEVWQSRLVCIERLRIFFILSYFKYTWINKILLRKISCFSLTERLSKSCNTYFSK